MFQPRNLTRKQVKKVVDDYLGQVEISQLQEHLRLFINDHAPDGQVELDDSHALVAKLEAERDRLVALARKGK